MHHQYAFEQVRDVCEEFLGHAEPRSTHRGVQPSTTFSSSCYAKMPMMCCSLAAAPAAAAVSAWVGGEPYCQDVRCATLLSELVYRAAESADEAGFRQAQAAVEEAVGASLNHVRCHKSGGQR